MLSPLLAILAFFIFSPAQILAAPITWHVSRQSQFDTTFIKVNPANVNEIFASVRLTGGYDLLRSYDKGETWQSVKQNLPTGLDVNWISIPNNSTGTIAISLWGSGFFTSNDHGSSWRKILDSSYPRSIEIDQTDPSIIFAGIGGNNSGESGVYKTTNGGNFWLKLSNLGDKNNAQIHIDEKNHNRIFADADPNFYRSMDGGDNWSVLPFFNAFSIGTVIDGDNHDIIYTGSWGNNPGPYKSTDNGDTWIAKNNGFGNGYVFGIVKDEDGNLYVSKRGGDGGLWKSSDRAESWQNISDSSWGNRNTWGLDVGGNRIFVAVEGLGIYYADLESNPPASPALNPVVIIPGFGASWSYKGLIENQPTTYADWQLLPFFADNVYGPLISSFEAVGFVKNTNLFIFPYDFRRSITDLAQSLRLFLDQEVIPKNPDKRIDVIAHSMGGLIVRQCVEKIARCTEITRKIVTAGSPHQGALKAYKLWEGGIVDEDNVVSRVIEEAAISSLYPLYLTRKDVIQNHFPGVRDFLPVFDYLSGKPYISLSTQAKNNNLMSLLPMSSSFITKLITFSGSNQPTDSEYKIVEPNWWEKTLGLWADGKPVSNITKIGDGTVLKTSSENLLGINKYYSLKHTDYFRDQNTIYDVFSFLNLPTPEPITSQPLITSLIGIFIHSPATISITDDNNNQIGLHDSGKAIFIPNPPVGIYNVKVTGTAAGDYIVEILKSQNGSVFRNTFAGSTYTGKEQIVKFSNTDGAVLPVEEVSITDLYYSLLSRLAKVNRSDRIVLKVRLGMGMFWWHRGIAHDDETEKERFDDFRGNFRYGFLLSAYRDIGKILAKENDSAKRDNLKESNKDLAQIVHFEVPNLRHSKSKIQGRIDQLKKMLVKGRNNPSMLDSLNRLDAQQYLNEAQIRLNSGDDQSAYILCFMVATLL